jgi:hypothetical protein
MASAQESAKTAQAANRISPESLARLWPNRVHESNWLKSLACWLGSHRWYEMRLEGLMPASAARFCRWCPKVEWVADVEAVRTRPN